MDRFVYLEKEDKWINPNSIRAFSWNRENECWQIEISEKEIYLLRETEASLVSVILTGKGITSKDIQKKKMEIKKKIKKELKELKKEAQESWEKYKKDPERWAQSVVGNRLIFTINNPRNSKIEAKIVYDIRDSETKEISRTDTFEEIWKEEYE